MKSSYPAPRRVFTLGATFAALVLAGCPGPTFVVQQYGGPQRPRETVATLRVNGSEPARLLFLDDQDVAAPIVEDGRLHIEILPGPHTVVVANASAPNRRYVPMTFQALPGKVYRVTFTGAQADESRVYEVGRHDDALIRDVTRSEDVVAPVPRTPAVAPTSVEDAGAPPEPVGHEDAG